MRLTFDGTFFRLHDASPTSKEAFGLSYDRGTHTFYTPLVKIAARLREYADQDAKILIDRSVIHVLPWSGGVPFPEGVTPKDFQLEATRFALSRNRSYLWLDPGTGKTVIGSLIANALKGFVTVIICPPYLQTNWAVHLERWQVPGTVTAIMPDSLLYKAKTAEAIQRFTLVNPSCLVVDEAHRFKSGGAKRTRALLGRGGLLRYFEKVTFMSGTALPNARPMELWPVLKRCAPECIDFMEKFDFGVKYCGGHVDKETGHWDFSGVSNYPEFYKRITEKFVLRMKKCDVLDLPPKTEELLFIGRDISPTLAALERKHLAHHSPHDLMRSIAANDHVSTYQRLLGEEKVPFSAAVIRGHIEDTGEAVVAFVKHRKVASELARLLGDLQPLVITGDTDKHDRQKLVDEFQNNPARKLLIGNIDAAGTGFTMTKAHRVDMVEYKWTPGENEQAIDRTHRIGQSFPVNIYYHVFANSIDRKLIESNLTKRNTLTAI